LNRAGYTETKYQFKERLSDEFRLFVFACAFDGEFARCRYDGTRLRTELFTGGIKRPTIGGVYHCDHIIPESYGGEADWWNMQALCERCNKAKLNHRTFHTQVHAFVHGTDIDYKNPVPELRKMLKEFDHAVGNKYQRMWIKQVLPVDMREKTFPHRPLVWGWDEEAEEVNPELAYSINLATKTRGVINFARACKNKTVVSQVLESYEFLTGIDPVDFWNHVAIDILRELDL